MARRPGACLPIAPVPSYLPLTYVPFWGPISTFLGAHDSLTADARLLVAADELPRPRASVNRHSAEQPTALLRRQRRRQREMQHSQHFSSRRLPLNNCPSLSFPAKTNQQGHKAKEATSNEEAAAPACIWPSNGCCSPEIGAGKPSNRIFRGASRCISLPVL